MQRCSTANSKARGPQLPAKGVDGIRAPVKADSKVRLLGLRRETVFEDPSQIRRRNSDAIVTAAYQQVIASRLLADFRILMVLS